MLDEWLSEEEKKKREVGRAVLPSFISSLDFSDSPSVYSLSVHTFFEAEPASQAEAEDIIVK